MKPLIIISCICVKSERTKFSESLKIDSLRYKSCVTFIIFIINLSIEKFKLNHFTYVCNKQSKCVKKNTPILKYIELHLAYKVYNILTHST